ncbi:MAG: hypothetical protein Q8K37_05175, partial [Alphaproteobacteria bacterium]|nr:hypothetical protein [Alphaproteobacteria bacterium]
YAYKNPSDDFISSSVLIDISSKIGIEIKEINDLDAFLKNLNKSSSFNTKIIFTGSLYFVGQIMRMEKSIFG